MAGLVLLAAAAGCGGDVGISSGSTPAISANAGASDHPDAGASEGSGGGNSGPGDARPGAPNSGGADQGSSGGVTEGGSGAGAGLAAPGEPSVDEPPGAIACYRLAAAIEAGSLMSPGIVEGITNSAQTADAPLADAALRLQTAFRAALTARGKADEPDAVAAVSTSASDMSGVCSDSGLRTAG